MTPRPLFTALFLLTALSPVARAQDYIGHDRNRPLPPVVSPAVPSTETQVGRAPSDAIVLFDGSSLGAWSSMDGSATRWALRDGALECVPGAGMIRTQEAFGACQLHLEFATPAKVEGSGQGRGNSGVFFALGRYEIQVLDSYENPTYADGSCGSLYNQFPVSVNASRKPGEWQTYDIVWTPPTFDPSGKVITPAYVTLFHNGVLVHYHRALLGPNNHWFIRQPYSAHQAKLPIAFQDHGNPVRFRNIWIRPLDNSRREVYLAPEQLDSFVGAYKNPKGSGTGDDIVVRREGDTLFAKIYGGEVALRAATKTQFFYSESDMEITFEEDGSGLRFTVGGHASGSRVRR